MIRYLKNTEIDKLKWDKCIHDSLHGIIYSLSWYLDIVSPGWEGLVEGDYQSVFPFTHRKKAGFNYLYQPHFTQQLGLYGRNQISSEKLFEFISSIPDKFLLIEIQLNYKNNYIPVKDFRIEPKRTFHLNLSEDIEKIKTGYSENLKRNIKKAGKSNLKIIKNIAPSQVIDLFRLNRGKDIGQLKESDYKNLNSIFMSAGKKDLLDCRGIFNDKDQLIAGAAFLKSMHSHIFHFSALSDDGRESGAMSYLIDSYISDHASSDSILDFEGSMDEQLARFYKSFGSKEIVYLQILKNKLPLFIRWLK